MRLAGSITDAYFEYGHHVLSDHESTGASPGVYALRKLPGESTHSSSAGQLTRSLQKSDLQIQEYSAILGQNKHEAYVSESHLQ